MLYHEMTVIYHEEMIVKELSHHHELIQLGKLQRRPILFYPRLINGAFFVFQIGRCNVSSIRLAMSSIARLMCGSPHWSLRCRPPQVCAR